MTSDNEAETFPSDKHGGGIVMNWACFFIYSEHYALKSVLFLFYN